MPLSCEKPVLAVAFLCFLAVSKTVTAFGIHPGTLETRFGNTRHAIPSKSRLHLFDLFNAGKKALVRQLAGEYDQVAIRARLDGLIKDSPVLFFSFETCPYCVKAKAILDDKKCRYTNVDLQKDPDGKALRSEMGELLGRTSVPAIWINGEFVGGCNDGPGIVSLETSGKLDSMLSAAGAL